MMNKKMGVGIDLGSANSCVAVVQDGQVKAVENNMNNRLTPSYIAFTDTERLIGDIAKNQAAKHLNSLIFDVKRIIGRRYKDELILRNKRYYTFKIVETDGKIKIKANYKSCESSFAPEEITAMLLTNLKDTATANLQQEVKHIVISVPAFFNSLQRQAIIDAGIIACLNVSIINEPVAAALAFGYYKRNMDKKTVLFFDFGFGKLEVSIVQFQAESTYDFEIKATANNINLGGAELDRIMVEHLMNEFKRIHRKDVGANSKSYIRLLTAWEEAKIVLSSNVTAYIHIDALFEDVNFCIEITREKFEEVCNDTLKAIIEPVQAALDSANIDKYQIDEVVLIGGSTRIPKVQTLLKDFFNKKELNKSLNADEAIAIGAAIQTQDILNKTFYRKIIDIIPYSLSCSVNREEKIVIFNKGTKISKWYHTFHTSKDYQSEMKFSFYTVTESDKQVRVGTYTYRGIPAASKGKQMISLKCKMDNNSIFSFFLQDIHNFKWKKIKIKKENILLTQKELQILQKGEESYKKDEKEQKEKEEYIYRFEQFLRETKPDKHSSRYEGWSENKTWLEENCHKETHEIKARLESLKQLYLYKMSPSVTSLQHLDVQSENCKTYDSNGQMQLSYAQIDAHRQASNDYSFIQQEQSQYSNETHLPEQQHQFNSNIYKQEPLPLTQLQPTDLQVDNKYRQQSELGLDQFGEDEYYLNKNYKGALN